MSLRRKQNACVSRERAISAVLDERNVMGHSLHARLAKVRADHVPTMSSRRSAEYSPTTSGRSN